MNVWPCIEACLRNDFWGYLVLRTSGDLFLILGLSKRSLGPVGFGCIWLLSILTFGVGRFEDSSYMLLLKILWMSLEKF